MFCNGEKCHCILSVAEEERYGKTGVQKCFVCIQKGKEHVDNFYKQFDLTKPIEKEER